MKRCFSKKTIWGFIKCILKTLYVFWISILYSTFVYGLKMRASFARPQNKKTVFVGISGGVDSSVSAVILKEKKYNVVGVFIKVYQPDIETFCWRNEMLDAKKICKQLKIPFIFLDLEKEYKRNIFDYMIDSYKKGETPNPDVFCNKFIKFGAFLKNAEKFGADYIAMGHYARVKKKIINSSNYDFQLLKGIDENKDQSYFLSALSQKQLSKTLFPIGELQKSEVRKIAEKNNLITASKKDSQGLCFVGKVDMRDFLQKFISKKMGDILNLDGNVIGEHQGVVFYTIGERHGFKIFPKFMTANTPRLFVLKKDLKNNTITVGEKNFETEKILNKKKIEIKNVNWISGISPDFTKTYSAMVRYRGKLVEARLFQLKNENKILVKFSQAQNSIAKGQVMVIYEDDICLGEGEI